MNLGPKIFRCLNPKANLSRLPGFVRPTEENLADETAAARHPRPHLRPLLTNFPLLFGGLILLGLFLVVLFGPLWAPRNPYIASQHIVPHFDPVRDEWISPPLSPSAEYPLGTDEWGNDIFSMLLYGARNTLIASAFITLMRILLGLILGAYAGWHAGKISDQLIMGLIGIITSVPMLISSMILIFALDIRRGLPVFIIALSVIGWTEIAQYIRSEFLILRQMPYIEGAYAAGATNLAIAVRHILPNLLPQLLVISFLELGAALMLMGELGFVGVFIGGGSRIALGDELTGLQVVTLSEVPEWGAMLAEGYRWLRAKPFIVFPPAIAFFVAVMGFTAFGEGLRRFIDQYHVSTNFLLRKRMVVVIALLVYATIFIINNTGPAPWFARVARAFNGDSAYEHTQALAAMAGRGSGQPGGEEAAAYIAQQFAAYGLQPGWKQSSYIYPMETPLTRPLSQPQLTLLDANGRPRRTFQHQQEFGFVTTGHGGSGSVTQPLLFVGFSDVPAPFNWESFAGLDLRQHIVLLWQDNAPPDFATEALIRGAQGILWVTADAAAAVRSQIQTDAPYFNQPTLPIFHIRPTVAQAILNQDGQTITELFNPETAGQRGPNWFTKPLQVQMQMTVELSQPITTAVPHVLGYLPGSDFEIANEMIVLLATYDGLGTDPDGTVFPAANHNAAGVSLLLELARSWQEQDLNPRRSVLFIAWGSSQLDQPGLDQFLANSRTFRHLPAQPSTTPLAPRAIIQVDYAGAGGDSLYTHPNAAPRLITLLETSAAEIDLSFTTAPQLAPASVQPFQLTRTNWLYLAWANAGTAPEQDTAAAIDPQKLQTFGELLSHLLTQMVRQSRY